MPPSSLQAVKASTAFLLLCAFGLLGLAVSMVYGFEQERQSIGHGFSFQYRPEWQVKQDGESWELTHPSMPPIGVQWESAAAPQPDGAHRAAVAAFTDGYAKRYGLSLRNYGTRSTRDARGELIFETELGTEVNGNLVRFHYQTLLLEGRLLTIVGSRRNDQSSVNYAREIAGSVDRLQPVNPGSQPLLGRWTSPGAPHSAVIIFRREGTVESDEPIAGRRFGRYRTSSPYVQLTWKPNGEQETWSFRLNGNTLDLKRSSGWIRYTRDDL